MKSIIGTLFVLGFLLSPVSGRCGVEGTAQGIRFTFAGADAQSVYLAGDFNGWSTTSTPLARDPQGMWSVTIPVSPGKHEYKLVVDGQWVADPSNQVSGGAYGNSLFQVAPDGSLVELQATSNTPVSARVLFSGDFRSYVFIEPDSTSGRQWRMRNSFHDAKLDLNATASEQARAWIRLHFNSLWGREGQSDVINVRMERARFDFQRTHTKFTGVYNVWILAFDNFLPLIGQEGEYKEDFGRDEQGVILQTHLPLLSENILLYSNEISSDRDVFAWRMKRRVRALSLGATFKDENGIERVSSFPDPDSLVQNGGLVKYNAYDHRYFYAMDARHPLGPAGELYGEIGRGSTKLVGGESDQGMGVWISSGRRWDLDRFGRGIVGIRHPIRGGLKGEFSFETEGHHYTRYRGYFSPRYDRYTGLVSYTRGPLDASLTLQRTQFRMPAEMNWDYLWDYSRMDQLEYFLYPLVGYASNYIVEPHLSVSFLRSPRVTLEVQSKVGKIAWNTRPKTVETLINLKMDSRRVGCVWDARLFRIADAYLDIDGSFFSSYEEISYKLTPRVVLKLTTGLYPYTLDNDYRARTEFLHDEGANASNSRRSYGRLGSLIRQAEAALQSYRGVAVRGEMTF